MIRIRRERQDGDVRRHRWILALLGAFLVLGMQGATTGHLAVSAVQAESSTLRVSAHDGWLSIEAQAASWVEVLDNESWAAKQ